MNTQEITLSPDLSTLRHGGTQYRFFSRDGVVVSPPVVKDDHIEFFFKNEEKGKEYSATLNSKISARETHVISILYCQKNKAEVAYPVAWVNHTTDEMDYLEHSTREAVGNKASLLFFQMGLSVSESMSNLSAPHGGFINLLLIPIYLIFLASVLACLLLGSLLGLKSERVVKKILKHANMTLEQNHIAGVRPYKKKGSKILGFIKWAFILYIGGAVLLAVGNAVLIMLG